MVVSLQVVRRMFYETRSVEQVAERLGVEIPRAYLLVINAFHDLHEIDETTFTEDDCG